MYNKYFLISVLSIFTKIILTGKILLNNQTFSVIFSGYNYPSAAETLCWLTNLYLCGRHFNSLKPLPESQHLLSTGKRDSKMRTVLTLHFLLTPLAKVLKWWWEHRLTLAFSSFRNVWLQIFYFFIFFFPLFQFNVVWFCCFSHGDTTFTGGLNIAPATAVLVWHLVLSSRKQKMVIWTTSCWGCCFLNSCSHYWVITCPVPPAAA